MGTLKDYIDLYRAGADRDEMGACAGLTLLQVLNMNSVLCRLGVISREDIDERRTHINRGRIVDEQYTAMGNSLDEVLESIRTAYRSGISGFKFASEYSLRNSHGVYAMYSAFVNMGVFTEDDVAAHKAKTNEKVIDVSLPWQRLEWPVNLLKFVASRNTGYLYFTDAELNAVEEIYSRMKETDAAIVEAVMMKGMSVQQYASSIGKSKQYIYSVLKTISNNIYQKLRYCFAPTVSSMLAKYGVPEADSIFDVRWRYHLGYQTLNSLAYELACNDLYLDGMEYWAGDSFKPGAMALYCFKHHYPVETMLHNCGLVVDYDVTVSGQIDLDGMTEVQQFIAYYSHVEVLSVKHIAILLEMTEADVRAVMDT